MTQRKRSGATRRPAPRPTARRPRGGVEGTPERAKPRRGTHEEPGHRKGELGDPELDQAGTARRPRVRSRGV